MRSLLVAVLLVAAAAAGCFGGDDDDPAPADPTDTPPTNGGAQPTNTTDPAPTMRDPVTWDVEVGDNSFTPGSLTVQVGDTVRWTHVGDNPHTVTATDGSFNSHADCDPLLAPVLGGCMANGDTFQFTFDAVGSVSYGCEVHGAMTGSVEVLERHDPTPA